MLLWACARICAIDGVFGEDQYGTSFSLPLSRSFSLYVAFDNHPLEFPTTPNSWSEHSSINHISLDYSKPSQQQQVPRQSHLGQASSQITLACLSQTRVQHLT